MTPDVLRYAMLNLQGDRVGAFVAGTLLSSISADQRSRALAGNIADLTSALETLKQESSDAVLEWAKLVVDHG